MALEGNLSSFGLSEILQLIAVQQKTGMLTVSNESEQSVFFFTDGQVVSSRDRRRKAADPFKDYLTRYGILSAEQLLRISQISSQSKLDFVDILMSEQFIDEEQLNRQWHKQLQEAVHDVLTWEQCSYKFISNDALVDGIKTLGQFSVEAMLMESMRRIDEFPQMLEMFPHDEILFERTDKEVGDDDNFTQNEKDILALISGNVSLRNLVARGGMPLFEVYEALKLLKDKELVTFRDVQPTASEVEPVAAPAVKRRPLGNVVPLIAASLLFVGSAFLGFRGMTGVIRPVRGGLVLPQNTEIARSRTEHNIRWLLEAHRAELGVYPETLDGLVTSGLAPRELVERAEEFELRYRLTTGRLAYTLL